MRRIAVFASGAVGLEVVRYMAELGYAPALLCLDKAADSRFNGTTRIYSGLKPHRIFHIDADTAEVEAALSGIDFDLIILAWWPYIVKPSLLAIPKDGALNLHPSYLPYNRGKHYNFWNIVEDNPFGVTIHHVDEGVDTGDIAFQARIETSWEDTGATLYDRAQKAIVELFKANYETIRSGQIPRVKQDDSQATAHHSRELTEASRIWLDLTYTGRHLLNLLRARTFPPHPAAWFMDGNGEKCEVRVEIRKVGP